LTPPVRAAYTAAIQCTMDGLFLAIQAGVIPDSWDCSDSRAG
jgi:hypothetical protein